MQALGPAGGGIGKNVNGGGAAGWVDGEGNGGRQVTEQAGPAGVPEGSCLRKGFRAGIAGHVKARAQRSEI